jgi:hypothetical protein
MNLYKHKNNNTSTIDFIQTDNSTIKVEYNFNVCVYTLFTQRLIVKCAVVHIEIDLYA